MALADRVKSIPLRASKGFSLGLTQTNYNAWSAGAMPGGEALSVSVSGTSQPISGNINTDIIFGHDLMRYGCVSSIYAGCFRATSIGDGTRLPTSLTGSTNASVNGYVEYPAGQYVLAPSFTALKGYKDGANYPIGTQKLMTLRGHDGSSYKGASIAIYGTMSTPPINTNDVFGLGVNARVGDNIIGANGRDGPTTGTINYTPTAGSFMEVFAHLRYYGEIADNPAATNVINIQCTQGNFADNNGVNLGNSVNFAAVRYQPPVIPLGSQTTVTLTMTVNLHGFVATDTCTVVVTGGGGNSGGISQPGPNIEPTEKAYGLSILSPTGQVRFQADADDAIAQHVKTQKVNASSGSQYITGLSGCTNANSIAVCAEQVPNAQFELSAEASPALSFTGDGRLQVKGAAIPHSISVLRIKGASTGSSSYGIEIEDSSGSTVLDDGELGLGVIKEIFFSANDWITFLSYSALTVNFGTTFSESPLIGIRTDKNLFVSRPYCYNPGYQGDAYSALRVYAPGKVASSGSILLMASNNQKANLYQYPNDDYGMQIFNAGGDTVFDSRQRIAAVTDSVSVNRFTTGSSVSGKNIASGKSGITSQALGSTTNDGNVHTVNQLVNVGINGNPAKDYLCMNGVIGLDTSKRDFIGFEKWGLCARFNPSSQGIQLQNNYIGSVIATQTNSHPEGNMLIVRSY